jgi:hypothetical protein
MRLGYGNDAGQSAFHVGQPASEGYYQQRFGPLGRQPGASGPDRELEKKTMELSLYGLEIANLPFHVLSTRAIIKDAVGKPMCYNAESCSHGHAVVPMTCRVRVFWSPLSRVDALPPGRRFAGPWGRRVAGSRGRRVAGSRGRRAAGSGTRGHGVAGSRGRRAAGSEGHGRRIAGSPGRQVTGLAGHGVAGKR